MNLDGLNVDKKVIGDSLLKIENKGIQGELDGLKTYFKKFGDKMPKEILGVLDTIEKKIKQ